MANSNGLPRLRVVINSSGITLTGTRRTTDTSLQPVIFTSGGLGTLAFGSNQNTITVINPNDSGPDGTSGTISASFENFIPGISVTKSALPTAVSTVGETVNYSFSVANTGNYEIVGITLNDPLVGIVCPITGNNTISSIAVGNSTICNASYDVPLSQFDSRGGGDDDIDNIVSVSGTSATLGVSDSDSTAVALNVNSLINVTKVADNTSNVTVGQVITYTYQVSNVGNTTICWQYNH